MKTESSLAAFFSYYIVNKIGSTEQEFNWHPGRRLLNSNYKDVPPVETERLKILIMAKNERGLSFTVSRLRISRRNLGKPVIVFVV